MSQIPHNRVASKPIFRFLMFLIPVLFFALVEIGLRIADYGGDWSLFRSTVVRGKTYYTLNPDVTKRYFRSIQVRGVASTEFFAKDKGQNTCRIFCLGESSTLGYPYMFNGSFPSMLKDRLETLWPEKDFEVINLGITAVNSYTAADFASELVRFQPDAILVYCGHNEYYGALGVSSTEGLGKYRWLIKLYLNLENWRTFRLVRDGIGSIRQAIAGGESDRKREATAMEGMVKSREIRLGSDEYETGADNFRKNLEEIGQVGSEHNVPVIFGTLVSNLSGLQPFVSIFSAGTDGQKQSQWESSYSNALEALKKKDLAASERFISAALAIDSIPAKGHFILGKVLEAEGRFDDASKEYREARDLDGLRFRAPSDFNRIIREVASHWKSPVAEAESLVIRASNHGIIGEQFMLEHVHLNIDGYFLLAKAFTSALSRIGVPAPAGSWHWELDKSDSEYRSRVAVTSFDSVAAAMRLHVLIHSWPFREGGMSVSQYEAKTNLEHLAKLYLMQEITWEQAHVRLAETYEAQGQLNEAAGEYRALAKSSPLNASPLLRLGQIMLNGGNTDEAETAFTRALKIEDSFIGYQGLGYLALRRNDFDLAIRYLKKAMAYVRSAAPESMVETQQMLAVSLASKGSLAEAKSVVQGLLRNNPGNTVAQELLQKIDRAMNQSAGRLPQ